MAQPLPPAFSAAAAVPLGLNDVLTSEPRDPVPCYQPPRDRFGGDIWAHWAAADSASSRVTEVEMTLATLEPELQAQTKEFERLKGKSAKLFSAIHGQSRSILPNALKRFRSGSSSSLEKRQSMDASRQNFELAHREETSVMIKVDSLREEIKGLKKQMDNNMQLASETDEVFELLAASVAAWHPNGSALVSGPEQHLADVSTKHDQAQKLVTDLLRARVTVQHAHHYYTIVLNTIDAVRGTALGRAALGGLGEMSKNKDYQVAAATSGKAQVCFNETVRVITPHMALIPPDILTDFEKLKELGLLQATKIYGLMYGWRSNASTIGQSTKLMLERQETAFACLTRFAVWVQNKVPVAEAELRAARIARDQARRDLVAAWKAQLAGPPPES